MKKIRVLHILSDTNIGGAGRLLFNLSQSVNKSNIEFVFAFPKGSKLINLFKDQGSVYCYSGNGDKSFELKSLISIIKVIKQSKPHIVHTHSSLVGRLAAIISGVKREQIIYTKHCVFDIPPGKKKPLRRKLYRFFDNMLSGHVVAVAEPAKKELIDIGVDPSKITVIINGSIPLKAVSDNEKYEIKKSLGISSKDFVVGISARLESYKGHKTLIKAALLAKRNGQNIKFIIMGDGSKREELENYVKNLGLQETVIFTGFVENINKYMNIFDLNINCSTGTETSSLSISEGLSLGTPAIVSDFGGNPNMVINGVTGYVFEKNNHVQLYKIIQNLKNSPKTMDKLRVNAAKDFDDRFSAIQMARQYEEFYIKAAP